MHILGRNAEDSEGHLSTESDLCRELNVSRTVLRQAIKVLEAKGLVEVRPRMGVRVRPRDHWNLVDPDLLAWQTELRPDTFFIRNLYEVRMILEPAAAELAAVRANDEEIRTLERWYSEMERTAADTQAFIAADLQFHSAIFAACHNDLLQRMSSTIGNALRTSRVITTRRPGSSTAVLRDWLGYDDSRIVQLHASGAI